MNEFNDHQTPGRNTEHVRHFVVEYSPMRFQDDCQNPGKPYPGLTKTAFLPLSPAGSEVLDLLQRTFEARVTFRFSSTPTHPSGELIWNDILHKESIYGGPKA